MKKEEKKSKGEEHSGSEDGEDDDETHDSGGVGKRGVSDLARFRALPEQEQAALKKRAAEEAKVAKETWKAKMEAPPSTDPAEIQK
jgi:hypothetical protein